MAEESKEIDWQQVIIGIVLFVLSSSTSAGMKYLPKIPVLMIIVSLASFGSCIAATIALDNGLKTGVVDKLNPL